MWRITYSRATGGNRVDNLDKGGTTISGILKELKVLMKTKWFKGEPYNLVRILLALYHLVFQYDVDLIVYA